MGKKISQNKSYSKLVEEHRLFSYLMENTPDVIYFKDRKGKLVLVNSTHAKGVGAKPEDVIGKTDFDFFPKHRAEVMAKDDNYVINKGKPIIDKVERATRVDGVDNYVSTTKLPMFNDKGKVVGLVGITRDITKRIQYENLCKEKAQDRKRLEALEEMNRLKSEFISVVSHELRTPLAIIKQLVTIICDGTAGSINDKQKDILKRAELNITRLSNMINELLDMSKIESSNFSLHYSLVDFNDLIENSLSFFRALAKEKNIEVISCLPKRRVNVFIDVDRINQIIANLISNAIKFTEEGGVVKVELKILETKIRLGVIDAGVGISKEDIAQVFNKFKQISKKLKTKREGVGLGLSIVKELVQRHKGEIWAESKLGVGSKFYFTIPRFYVPSVLTKSVKDRVDKLLIKEQNVNFVNFFIVNYADFKKRIKVSPEDLFGDLEKIIELVFSNKLSIENRKSAIILLDSRQGRSTIIFAGANRQKADRVIKAIREKAKDYFEKRKLGNVFMTIGFMPYLKEKNLHPVSHFPASHFIKEIYIGSEVRRFKRVRYEAKIKILTPGKKVTPMQTIDLSEGGICLYSKYPLRTDSFVRVTLDVEKGKKVINLNGRVAWVKKISPFSEKIFYAYEIGIEFVKLKEKERKDILREIKKAKIK